MRLRPATLADHARIAALTAELATGDPPPSRERFLTMHERITVAEPDDQPGVVVGYLLVEVLDGLGYIRHLVSAPEARRTGVGRTLMLDFAAKLREAGVRTWCLNVKPENTPAVALYAALGMRRVYDSWSFAVPWELGRSSLDIRVRSMRPEDIPVLERSFFVTPGVLALHLGIAHKRMLVAERGPDDSPVLVGLASYDLDFGGAFPCAADGVNTLTALIHACENASIAASNADRGRIKPPDFKVVIERHAALADALRAAGATLRLAFTHMEGAVPPAEPT